MCRLVLITFLLCGVIIASSISSLLNFVGRFKRIAEKNCQNSTDTLPYLIKLFENHGKGEHFLCSAVLLHSSFVVTAAHCVTGLPLDTILARSDGPVTNSETRGVTTVYSPRDYGEHFKDLDLAVIKVNESFVMESSKLQPIELYDKRLGNGDRLEVSGWGRRRANSTVLSWRRCAKLYSAHVAITRNMFCGELDEKVKVCTADAGGPVVHDNKLCGIVLWSSGWINTKYPEVYLSIRPVRRFLSYIMNNY